MKKLLLTCLIIITGKIAFAQCDADFHFIVNSLNPPQVVFTDSSSSSNPIVSYQWDFGDGTTDTGIYVFHTFPADSVYTVCLTIDDGQGCTDVVCHLINATPSAPTINCYLYIDSMNIFNCISPADVNFYFSTYVTGYPSTDSVLIDINFGDGIDSSFYYSTANSNIQFNLHHNYLNAGSYSATALVTGPDTTMGYSWPQTLVVSSSCGSLGGTVYEDVNSNCIFDAGDVVLENIGVAIYNSGQILGYVTTDVNGYYSFNVPTGSTYDLQVYVGNSWIGHYSAFCPATGGLSTSTIPSSTNDFGLSCPQGYDLQGWVSGWGFRPGFTNSICITAFNERCITPSGQIELTIDPLVTPLPDSNYTITGNTIIIPINSPDLYWSYCIPVSVSTSAQIGDSLCVTMNILPVTGDSDQTNNSGVFCFAVRSSYDPNDKYVVPAGVGPQGYIRPDEELNYTIRFQNTGNASAINIFILDTLDSDIDPSSIQLLGSSHDVDWTLLTGNILRFNFDNIFLPERSVDELGSQGYVSYRVRLNNSVTQFSTVENTAGIFFDFNPPIITNTTLNTVDYFLSVGSITGNSSLVNVYPNPSNEKCYMRFKDQQKRTIKINNALGNLVFSISCLDETYTLNTSHYSMGVYTVQIYDDNNQSDTFKLIVTR